MTSRYPMIHRPLVALLRYRSKALIKGLCLGLYSGGTDLSGQFLLPFYRNGFPHEKIDKAGNVLLISKPRRLR